MSSRKETKTGPASILKRGRFYAENGIDPGRYAPGFERSGAAQPLRVSAQAAYLATFSSQAALLSPLARI